MTCVEEKKTIAEDVWANYVVEGSSDLGVASSCVSCLLLLIGWCKVH